MANDLSPTATNLASSSTQQRPAANFLRSNSSQEPPKKRLKGPSAQEIQELQAAVLKREEQVLLRKGAVLEKLEKLIDRCLSNDQMPVFVSTLDTL
jgi:hypothetical protein